LRIGAVVISYPPRMLAGAETMLESIMRWLAHRGHDCRVYLPGESYDYHGVEVTGDPTRLNGCHVVFTQLEGAYKALELCDADMPLAHIIHNDQTLKIMRPRDCDLVVHNTQWIANKFPEKNEVIVHPPVFPKYFRTTPGDCITLINLNENKGVRLFYQIAADMPDQKFLGVVGGYGEQIIEDLPNVEIIGPIEDMREVYSRTRILLMPSTYESYGRCCIEAAASGIPTVANTTPGLMEALGDAGTFPSELNVDAWAKAIRSMDWDDRHDATLERFKELNPESELTALEDALYRTASRKEIDTCRT
jgi:glycosyltransferase involved in cell wall biosynthesis